MCNSKDRHMHFKKRAVIFNYYYSDVNKSAVFYLFLLRDSCKFRLNKNNPRAKRRSGRKRGARVTNSALAKP